jgi:hypothetical protein
LASVGAPPARLSLRRALPFIERLEDALPFTRGLLEGYIPGAALAAALALVPVAFQLLSRRQGCVSVSDADRQVASRVVLMADGQVVEMAPPDQFFTNPRHERSRQFLSQIA